MNIYNNFKKVVILSIILIFSNTVNAADFTGFDDGYQVFAGSSNNDELTDLYVTRSSQKILVLHGSPVIPISLTPVDDFILENNGDGTFSMVDSTVSDLSGWNLTEITAQLDDFNRDGFFDLILGEVALVVEGAFNQIVYAPTSSNQVPSNITPMDENFASYFSDLLDWMIDPEFFNNPPLVMNGRLPDTATILHAFTANFPSFEIAATLAACGSDCILTTTPPADTECIKLGNLTVDGEDQGVVTKNICTFFDIFIVQVEEGEAIFEPDFTVFNQEARETAEILERINLNCGDALLTTEEALTLGSISESVLSTVFSSVGNFLGLDNTEDHPLFPGDLLFDQADVTYHHYDVSSKICGFEEAGCEISNSLATSRQYTLPSQFLVPTFPAFDGSFETAFAAVPTTAFLQTLPGPRSRGRSRATAYAFPIGVVTQQQSTSVDGLEGGGRYFGSIQNITDKNHLVFPGVISRTVEARVDGLYGFTHGVGINRAFCSDSLRGTLGDTNDQLGGGILRGVGETVELAIRSGVKIVEIAAAFGNDFFGAIAFGDLDDVMIQSFRQRNGLDPLETKETIESSIQSLLPSDLMMEMEISQ